MRAGLYARVSTEEQAEGWSLDAQLGAMRAEAARRGWTTREYVDPGASGRTANRPGFQALLADVRAGHLDLVVVHKLDRFSRSLLDTLKVLGEFSERGVAFVSLSEQMDFTTPIGKVILATLGAFAQYYSDNLAEETRKGLWERARQGLYLGPLPFGYCKGLCTRCNDVNGPGYCPEYPERPELAQDRGDGRVPIPHPKDRHGVILAYELYGEGKWDETEIARALNAAGYRSRGSKWRGEGEPVGQGPRGWTREGVRFLLQNPFYLGLVKRCVNRGQGGKRRYELLPGQHEPLISQGLFDRCREVRGERRRSPRHYSPRFRVYLFGGLLRCAACGRRMTAMVSGSEGHRHKRYFCSTYRRDRSCSMGMAMIREDGIERQFQELIRGFQLPSDWRERVLELVATNNEREAIEAERRRLQEKLRRLRVLFQEVEISEGEYRRERDRVRARLSELVIPQEVEVLDAGVYLESVGALWEAATDEERRGIVRALFSGIWCDPRAKVVTRWEVRPAFKPFFRLKKPSSTKTWHGNR